MAIIGYPIWSRLALISLEDRQAPNLSFRQVRRGSKEVMLLFLGESHALDAQKRIQAKRNQANKNKALPAVIRRRPRFHWQGFHSRRQAALPPRSDPQVMHRV